MTTEAEDLLRRTSLHTAEVDDGDDAIAIADADRGVVKKITVAELLALAAGGAPAGFTFQETDSVFSDGPSITPDAPTTEALYLWAGDLAAAFGYLRLLAGYGAQLYAQNSGGSLVAQFDVKPDGTIAIYTDAGIFITGLPTADPLVAGQVYSDGVPSADTPKFLKISGGTAP